MENSVINIRDPFILPYNGRYYLYGTRAATCWGPADGFDVYTGTDLENWDGPHIVFEKDAEFWADRNYWAPEVYLYQGSFFMFASFKSADRRRGTQILKALSPLGPFVPHSDGPVTPPDWECLDGTLYIDQQGKPYMVFCHEWVQVKDGQVCAVELSADLRRAAGEPFLMFQATDAPWVKSVRGEGNFVTDGPFLHRLQNGRLTMIWSSMCSSGYAIGLACSASDEINGRWAQLEQPLFSANGGHGMLFRTCDNRLMLALHEPNVNLAERPVFIEMRETDNRIGRAEP